METPVTAEYPKLHDYFKKFAEGHMETRATPSKNLDLDARYPDKFFGKESNVDYELQLSNPMKESKKNVVMLDDDKKVDVVARFWHVVKDGNGKDSGVAKCYSLGIDGSWYLQTSNQSKDVTEKDTTEWTLGKARKIDDNESRIDITEIINRLQKPATKK